MVLCFQGMLLVLGLQHRREDEVDNIVVWYIVGGCQVDNMTGCCALG